VPFATLVRKGQYHDSVFLMRVANKMAAEPGVTQVAAVMGTDANKELLREAGFEPPNASAAGPNDLVVGVQSESDESVARVLGRIDEWLRPDRPDAARRVSRRLADALEDLPAADLAVISVPGQYAAREARQAIERGLNVFLFSDNVPVEQEIELKRLAAERGVIVMGPDCGTAIVAGVGVGFANVVRRGPIGVVGASGTGIQEVTTLVHRAGSGVSHAIGTGSRDPTDEVGGVSTFAALDALEADASTRVVVLVSKPPGAATLARIRERLSGATKPVVACFLGVDVDAHGVRWTSAGTLDEAAAAALRLAGVQPTRSPEPASDAAALRSRFAGRQRSVRGLFAGGSLCYQAQHIFRQAGIAVRSNAPIDPARGHDGARDGHILLDLGGDEFTRGRPHPMIDARLRRERIVTEGDDPATAVLLLDVILGYGAAADPGGDLVDAIVRARESARSRGDDLVVIASVTGTEADPQGLDRQTAALASAGVVVCPSGAAAARLAAAAVA
jgi:succinyl-CoA synthetase alpha subunit